MFHIQLSSYCNTSLSDIFMPKSDVLSAGTSSKEKKSEVPPDNISAKQMKGIMIIIFLLPTYSKNEFTDKDFEEIDMKHIFHKALIFLEPRLHIMYFLLPYFLIYIFS